MTPRHAAVLALVGWYLMLPPKSGLPNDTPLSKWEIGGSYDSAKMCGDTKDGVLKAYISAMSEIKKGKTDEQYTADPVAKMWFEQYERTVGAQCIATDDPRLAK